MNFLKKKTIYLDHASGTEISPCVFELISKCEKEIKGANPSSIHSMGVLARRYVEDSRKSISMCLSAHPDEIIFTGSGTESDALAIIGSIKSYRGEGIPHIITTPIEHSAVLENCRLLESMGEATVSYLPIDERGIVNPKNLRDLIRLETVIVSVHYANNEIGTVQPIEEIAKEIRYFRKKTGGRFPLLHTDACQAMNYLSAENIEKLGVDMLSFNGSKIYGPKGVGVLYKKRDVSLVPIYVGGGQEYGFRSGTENVSGIVGVAAALEEISSIKTKECERLTVLRDYCFEKIKKLSKESGYEIIINGDEKNRLPNNINISISGISSELIVIELDAKGIAVSEKSACGASDEGQSHVITELRKAQNFSIEKEGGSIRVSLGRKTTKVNIDYFIKILKEILNKYTEWK